MMSAVLPLRLLPIADLTEKPGEAGTTEQVRALPVPGCNTAYT